VATKLAERTIFSYEEAAALLPEVQRATDEAFREVEALTEGDHSEEGDARVGDVVRRWAESMIARGLEVKGIWLVDFDNGSGYYCWRHPEPGLMFYHSYEEGFRGRMRIQ
jgi:hypothetical protein